MKAQPGSIAHGFQTLYYDWLETLQSLTTEKIDDRQWTGRWYDGYSPAEALQLGPDEDWKEQFGAHH